MSGNDRLKCSFCGKTQDQVKKLIAGPDVSLKGSPTVSPTTAALC